jgi:hypothetical protein
MPDPIQLAISALADHIRTKIAALSSRCTKGWPDPGKTMTMPCASVTHGDPDREGHEALEISKTPVSGSSVLVDVAYEVADLTAPVQIDVWGRTRTERGEVAAAIRGLFTDPEIGDDLRLILSTYHGRLATFQIERWRDEDNAGQAERQEWRQTIELTLEVPEVAVKRQPLLKTITVTTQVYNADQSIS